MFRRAYPPAFEEAWRLYPRHVAKDDALRAWVKAVLRRDKGFRTVDAALREWDDRSSDSREDHLVTAGAASVLVGVERYAREKKGVPERKIAHMATWLNGRRWEDEPEEIIDDGAGRRADDVLRELLGSEFRARRLLDRAVPLARRLRLRDCDDGQLAHAVGRLLLDVDECHRANRCAEKNLALGALEVVQAYVEWVLERDYPDATTNVLRMDSASFGRFCAQLAHREDYGRDPVTGVSRYSD